MRQIKEFQEGPCKKVTIGYAKVGPGSVVYIPLEARVIGCYQEYSRFDHRDYIVYVDPSKEQYFEEVPKEEES